MACSFGFRVKVQEKSSSLIFTSGHLLACYKDRYSTILDIRMPFSYMACYAKPCRCNTVNALQQRVLNERNCYFGQGEGVDLVGLMATVFKFNQLIKNKTHLTRKLHLDDDDFYTERVCKGALRDLNRNALSRLRNSPNNFSKWIRLYCFAKCDRINMSQKYNNGYDQIPDVRAIQAIKREGNLMYARVIRPLEKIAYNKLSASGLIPCPYKRNGKPLCFGKGLNTWETADMVKTTFDSIPDVVVFMVDASRADAHLRTVMHTVKFEWFKSMFDGEGQRYIDEIRARYMKHRGTSLNGLKYSLYEPMLPSGSMDTALGNNFCFYFLHALFRRVVHNRKMNIIFNTHSKLKIPHRRLRKFDYAVLVNGDDCVPMMTPDMAEIFRISFVPYCAVMGIDMRIDGETRILEHIDWCQQQPIDMGLCYRMIRNPRKVITGFNTQHKLLQYKLNNRYKYLSAIGFCETALNDGVPMLQHIAHQFKEYHKFPESYIKQLAGTGSYYRYLIENSVAEEKMRGTCNHMREIKDVTRQSFQLAFGITVHQQLAFEKRLFRYNLSDSHFSSIIKTHAVPACYY